MLLNLPAELVSRIFYQLDGRSLARCRAVSGISYSLVVEQMKTIFSHCDSRIYLPRAFMVCRKCARVIDKDLRLHYHLTLHGANMMDSEENASTLMKKFKLLQTFLANGSNNKWTPSNVIATFPGNVPPKPLRPEQGYRLSSDVLVFVNGLHFHCMDFSKLVDGKPFKEWEFTVDGPVEVGYFDIDPTQNLLVIKEFTQGNSRSSLTYHIRSLENGKMHPLARAKLPPIQIEQSWDELTDYFEIYQEQLLVWVDQEWDNPAVIDNTITVYNWVTGELVRVLSGPYPSATFLGADHLLCFDVALGSSTAFRLCVFSLHGDAKDPPVLIFEYPQFQSISDLSVQCYFQNGLTTPRLAHKRTHRPFCANPEEAVLVICAEPEYLEPPPFSNSNSWQLISVIPVSFIFSQLRALQVTTTTTCTNPITQGTAKQPTPKANGKECTTSPRRIKWGAWPQFTISAHKRDYAYAYGSRVLIEQSQTLTVLDFDKKSLTSQASEIPISRRQEPIAEVPWSLPVESTLHPRVHRLPLALREGSSISDVHLDEDTILIGTEMGEVYMYKQT